MKYKFGKSISEEFINNKLEINSKKNIQFSRKLAKKANILQKKCYVCNGTKSTIIAKIFNIKYLKCDKCHHVFANKRLSQSELTKFYSENETYSKRTFANLQTMTMRESLFTPKIEFIKKYAKGKSWLDVGSADGAAMIPIQKYGFICKGLEISKESINFAKKYRNLTLFPETTFSLVSTKKKWNVISYFGVLHHIPNPIKELKNCNKLLSNGGIIVIDGPNADSISTYIQQLSTEADRHLVPTSHIMLFSLESLKTALEKTGFELVAAWFYGMDMIEFLKFMKNNYKVNNTHLFEFFKKNLNKFQFVIDKEFKSDFFMVIARKKERLA